MSDTDDDTRSYLSGYSTPPLSPTKTISTEGWFSPRTPGSPRKVQSCRFLRAASDDADQLVFTPSASPTKSKSTFLLDALTIPEALHTTSEVTTSQSNDRSPLNPYTATRTNRLLWAPTLARPHIHLTSNIDEHLERISSPHTNLGSTLLQVETSLETRRSSRRSASDSLLESSDVKSCPTPCNPDTIIDTPSSESPLIPNSAVSMAPPLQRFPIRCASSPLRPSQWVTRGGLLRSSRKYKASTPDRFIAYRRPPAVTRESFELNKLAERLEIHRSGRCALPSPDAFSHRLPRSGRLSEELHGLRDAHSIVVRRASASRRNTLVSYRRDSSTSGLRQISAGAVWNVGGPSAVSDTVIGVSTRRGGMLGSGTNAPLYTSSFLNHADPEAELEAYERRLALAFDVDQANRILQHTPLSLHNEKQDRATIHRKHTWRDGAWIKDGVTSRWSSSTLKYLPALLTGYSSSSSTAKKPTKTSAAFTIQILLDAPQLRDDYYCTLIAYSYTAKCLAVGLGSFVHLWSEESGVDTPESLNATPITSTILDVRHVTSLDFSPAQGGQAILAVGRADGRITLWSPFDAEPRFDAAQPKPVSCVSWRPKSVQRPSLRDRAMTVATEELLVGDEVGHIYFYSIEWPSEAQSAIFGWHGAMTLLARMIIHTQQICGLAWAPDGELFASGGNDNSCFLFETKKVLQANNSSGNTSATLDVREGPDGESIYTVTNRSSPVLQLPYTAARHKWSLNAAVKAMAFCPWQRGLIAIGGGSNDRCIHFYHTRSGTCLATIDCAAQVTGLVWSQTRREIAATFGFTQPEHPYRVAVFAWPSCEQIVAVPWWDENRALCAVAYPGGPTGSSQVGGDVNGFRGVEDGCIVVAASDMAIRFHEIWGDRRGNAGVGGLMGGKTAGLLGGSDILEGVHGDSMGGAVIR